MERLNRNSFEPFRKIVILERRYPDSDLYTKTGSSNTKSWMQVPYVEKRCYSCGQNGHVCMMCPIKNRGTQVFLDAS